MPKLVVNDRVCYRRRRQTRRLRDKCDDRRFRPKRMTPYYRTVKPAFE